MWQLDLRLTWYWSQGSVCVLVSDAVCNSVCQRQTTVGIVTTESVFMDLK